ncbi:MAG TPA: glycoside hydrolase family 57 protein [Planctomycetaceae bacterium]|jgi:alpha-amylase/alpha-mannosidase (GH57 family)
MQPISLALFWHQHQPYYPDDVSGETLMPWVRLHGTKDYYGMALHLKEVPEFRCTINLVPSLLAQILRYTEKGGSDRHLDVSRVPADGLSEIDAMYILDQFFMASVDNMIRPFPRYHELYLKRGFGRDSAEKALPRFSERDLRDLQVWNNLTWMHPLAFEQDLELRDLRNKGRFWTETDKQMLLEKQIQILKQIIPLHRELARSGQVELTTTPFYHPILPLLWDKRSSRQAMPECELPKSLDSYAADAKIHIERSIALHKELFGEAPVGMWPSEGSVSQDIIPAIARAGIEWIATDEEILARSTNGWISRDAQGHLRHPEMLYRPWRVEEQGSQLQIVFRDHGLSDLIGFHYQRSDPVRAAQDLLGRVEAIGRAVEPNNGGRQGLVSVILDGENCWEYYPDGGVEFLRTLYRSAARHPTIRPVRIRDHVRDCPAADRIGRLFAGSWISHNFAIWIGHHEDNTAWDLLHQTRQFLIQAQAAGLTPVDAIRRAWEEMYIAEGSDWFWWFGDDHSSEQDELFDQLFRKHLQNVYLLLGTQPPSLLNRPITRLVRRTIHSEPKGFLAVKVDGRRTYFEWINAGHYISGSERGTMTLVTDGVIREVFFGFDVERLMLRVDTARMAQEDLGRLPEIRIQFIEPSGYEIRITDPGKAALSARLFHNREVVAGAEIKVAVGQILEMTVRFADLGLEPEAPIQLYFEAIADGQSVDRAPREGALEMRTPSPDYEQIMWQA